MRSPAPLSAEVCAIAVRQEGLVAVRQLVASGVSRSRVERLVHAGVLVRVARGVYDVVGVFSGTGRFDRARRRAAFLGVLAGGPTAVATGLCALVLLGVHGAPREIAPEVTLRHGGPASIAGVRVRRVSVRATRRVDGVDVVVPEVALAQAVLETGRMTAVALMDSARHRRVLTERGFARARALAQGRRGAAGSNRWWSLSDPGSQSPAETVARLTCADAGYAPDVLQLVVRDPDGGFLARVDLAWLLPDGRWLLGEVDGIEWHSGRRDVLADLSRQNSIVTGRTILRRWTGAQAWNGTVAAEVAALLAEAGWTPAHKAPTTLRLDPPPRPGFRRA